jgi:large subunit ribosomal protein L32e
MPKKFIRRDSVRFSKIGKNRPKLQKWRKPKGRHNKMREKRKSYPSVVSVGYKAPKKEKGKISGQMPVRVSTFSDLKNLNKESLVILSSRLGAKKKMEIIKEAEKAGLKIFNLQRKIKESKK